MSFYTDMLTLPHSDLCILAGVASLFTVTQMCIIINIVTVIMRLCISNGSS